MWQDEMTVDELWEVVIGDLRKDPNKTVELTLEALASVGIDPEEFTKLATPDLNVYLNPYNNVYQISVKIQAVVAQRTERGFPKP